MRRKREYILVIAITCMSWGVFFPEYTFTADSYRLIMQNESSCTDEREADTETETDEGTDPAQIRAAVRDGRVRYRLRFAEYIKELFH